MKYVERNRWTAAGPNYLFIPVNHYLGPHILWPDLMRIESYVEFP